MLLIHFLVLRVQAFMFVLVFQLIFVTHSHASIVSAFKDEAGRTKWQHVANFSGSVLIVLLTLTLLSLLFSRFKLRATNKELREIKKNLELTVRKRTENLNRSNRLLQESNQLLEGEITEHKETAAQLLSSQNYLQSILASMPSMLIGLNAEMNITHWNRTAESITGLNASEVFGRQLWEVYPTITISKEQVEEVLGSGEPQILKHSQRGQYYFDITVYPLISKQAGVVVVVDNVTQRSLAENMLIQRDKMASMGELAATMAHDINMPLRGILDDVKAVSQRLSSHDELGAEITPLLDDAVERGAQARAVIDNLLDFAGTKGSEKHEAKITDILDHCVDLAANMISDPDGLRFKGVQIERKYTKNLPSLLCYSAELQQVFLSLFRHAVHAMSARKEEAYVPALTLEAFEAYDALWVKVQHNGVGMSVDEQQNIFEPFFQHTSPAKPKLQSLENRLSFSYFIVTEHHRGEMAVTSDPNVGSTFHIQFHI